MRDEEIAYLIELDHMLSEVKVALWQFVDKNGGPNFELPSPQRMLALTVEMITRETVTCADRVGLTDEAAKNAYDRAIEEALAEEARRHG